MVTLLFMYGVITAPLSPVTDFQYPVMMERAAPVFTKDHQTCDLMGEMMRRKIVAKNPDSMVKPFFVCDTVSIEEARKYATQN